MPLSIAGSNVIAAGISGLAGLLGGIGQNSAQKQTNATNLRIAQETNDAQERIAAANNQTQIDMMRENNDWSAKQAQEAFDREAAYNSASAQVQRYLDAGLNPAAIMASGSPTAASSSAPSAAGSTISPQMPQFVTPSMGTPPSVLLSAADSMAKVASSFAQVSQFSKTSKEGSWIDRLSESTIKHLNAQTLGEEAKAKFDNIMAQLNQEWMPKKAQAEIEKMFAETCAAFARGELDTANAMYTQLLEKFKSKELDILEQKAPFLVAEAKETVELIKQKQATEKSAQSANYASATASKAAANKYASDVRLNAALEKESGSRTGLNEENIKLLQDMHDDIVSLKHQEKELSWYEMYKQKRTIEQQVERILNETWISDETKQILGEQLETAKRTNDWYEWDKTRQSLLDISTFGLNSVKTSR